MTDIIPSSETSHDYLLRSGSKDTKRVLSPNNILKPPKTMKEEGHEPKMSTRQKEEEKGRRDQMKELGYHKLVANQRVVNNKIYDIKEEQENIKKEALMIERDFLNGNIGPDTFVACMEKNRERYVKNRDEIEELQKKVIKIDLGIQEIKEQLIKIKIHQYNESEKFEEAIVKNLKIQEPWKRFYNKLNQQPINRTKY